MILHNATDKKNYDYAKGNTFTKISKGECPFAEKEVKLNAEDGLYLMSSLEIGRDRYVTFSQFCRKRRIRCDNYNNIKRRKDEIVPKVDPCFDQGKKILHII